MDSKDEFVCRCCFYTGLESDFKDMLTEIIATNSNLTISEYFVSFSGISLEKDDSTRICPSCETKLKSAFEFREFIISKNIKVETIVYRIAVNEDPDADVYDTRFTEVSLSDNPSPEKIKPIKTSTKRRKPKTVSTDEEEFSDTANDEIEEIDVDVDDLSSCDFCSKKFQLASELCNHLHTHIKGKEKYICERCKQKFSSKFLLERHWATTHQENNFQCDDCGKTFPDRRRLKIHKIVHKETRDVKCPNCPLLFKDHRYLRQHLAMVHSGQKNFKCDVCERLFGSLNNLKNHMGIHFEDLRKFECELCQKKFIRVIDRDVHMQRTHRNERPFKCDKCPKAYYAGNTLRDHQRSVHTDVRFECKSCGNRYARSKSLLEHIFSHLGYKPFNCPASGCAKGFVKKETFKKHLTKRHIIEFDEDLHGFKGSLQDILKTGMKQESDPSFTNNSTVTDN